MGIVLVTGATGFIGGRVASRLTDRGESVRAIVRRASDGLAQLGIDQRDGGLEGLDDAAFDGVDRVVHVAASFDGDLATARAVNRDATRRLVELAVTHRVTRLVHVSTTAVYDQARLGDVVIDESAPLRTAESLPSATGNAPPTYGVTKAEGESAVEEGRRHGLSAAIVRPPAVLGAGPTSTWGTRVPRNLLAGHGFARHPDSTYAWVHVDDLAEATLAAMDVDGDTTVNVVAGHETVGAYLRRVVDALPRPVTIPEVTDAPWRGSYTTDRLRDDLGLTPRFGFAEAMDEIAAWWQQDGMNATEG